MKPNFSTIRSILEISRQQSLFGFLSDDSIKNHLGFNAVTIFEDCKL